MEFSVFFVSFLVMQYSGCVFAQESTQLYTRYASTYVDFGTETLDGVSVMQCGAACGSTDTCVSMSYNHNGSCQLNDRNPEMDDVTTVSSISGWTSYYTDKSLCDTGWYHYATSCYLPVHPHKSWDDSKTHCQSLGSHLADIHDDSEFQFIATTFHVVFGGREYWIGLNDKAQEDVFVWSTGGGPTTLDKFWPNEPQGGTLNNCVLMSLPGWNDATCDGPSIFESLCEKEHHLYYRS